MILLNLEYADLAPPEPLASLQRADVWRLESAALQHNLEAVVRDFERTLGISRKQARRIINDDLGEPIVVAAKAMMLPADVLQRMLLFVNPRVGQSVDRVYELAALYGEITVDAARRLLAILRDADRARAQCRYGTNRRRGAPPPTMRAGPCRKSRAGPTCSRSPASAPSRITASHRSSLGSALGVVILSYPSVWPTRRG